MNLKKVRGVLLIVLFGLVVSVAGFKMGERRSEVKWRRIMGDSGEVDLSLMWEVWSRLDKNYLYSDEIEKEKMVLGAISGSTAALDDPYTSFLAPEENDRSKEDLSGEFSGIGVQLGYIDKTLAVMAPLADHPAIRAGIVAGDLILGIKDEAADVDVDTNGMSLSEAVNLIRGEVGTEVVLTIYHEGDGVSKEVSLIRDVIEIPSVEVEFVGEGEKVAWLRVYKFGEKTLPEWNEAVDEILSRGVDGVVVDFRNNPGGYLQRAIDLSSEFIPSGVVVQQRGKLGVDEFSVNRRGRLIGVPLVGLINKGSASASEIMAGALRERLGISLVGENSFGKGTVQEAQELPGGGGLHVTIAEWLLPSGKNIHGDGLAPDVEIKDDLSTEEDEQLLKAIEVLRG